ncbi:type VI secretion system Vgr family protein, partial [Variovorax sp. RHLX14]|uniref:type VI secretion system Vgr family protein n=1 Tax=Variovorax sp. RHLX14 TaxID=1259731 RepID=UPI003F4537B9
LARASAYELTVISENRALDAKDILGHAFDVVIEFQDADGGTHERHCQGHAVRFVRAGHMGRHYEYRITLRSWFWLLTKRANSRILQEKKVLEVLDAVFEDSPIKRFKKTKADNVIGTHNPRRYCVQHQESDYQFLSRLLEDEGIYYWFRHEKDRHTLVLVDDIAAHDELPGYACIDCFATDRAITDDIEVIDDWQVTAEVRSGSYTVNDFNFTTPKGDLLNVRSQPRGHDNADYEMYEWLGDYPAAGDGEHCAKVRLEESQALAQRSTGHSTVRGMAPGYKFTMRNSPRSDDNQEYLVASVSYALREGGYATGSEPGSYDFNFVAQPTSLAFRSPRNTPPPRTSGPQT